MIGDNIEKLGKAIKTLKPNTEWIYVGDTFENETDFNTIKWVTGTNSIKEAITTTTNPHSELTWAKVKAEMDKL